MKYSNGFDTDRALDLLKNRVKWLGDTSESGRYFDDGSFHSLVTSDNFKAYQEKAQITDGDFTNVKKAFTNAAILRCLNAVFSPTIIDNTLLFDFPLPSFETEAVTNDFHGYKIFVGKDMVAQVKKAFLRFNANTTVVLYLYKAGNPTPVKTQSVVVVGATDKEVDLTDFFLTPGLYFLGYKPADLGGALPYRDQPYFMYSTYGVGICPIHASLPFSMDNIVYPVSPQGLNLEIISQLDYTNVIANATGLFDELIGLCLASMVVEKSLFTMRINPTERKTQESIDRFGAQMDLMGTITASNAPKTDGLRRRLEKEVMRVKASLTIKKTGIVSLLS